jgi:hypothetical protein|tara:strand:- start:62 stop:262 length:201 start_codon:yes stop_codon:yes gene_type:complete
MDFLWKIIGILSILLVFFGSMYNLFAAEQYAKKKLNYIPVILRYIAYGIGIFCSGYVIDLIVDNLM